MRRIQSDQTVLVIGATGRVGRLVVGELLAAGAQVRALTRAPERARLPAGAEVVAGDLTVPPSLDKALVGVDAVFLVWTAPLTTASAVLPRLALDAFGRVRRLVYLSAPFHTPHPFFQQPNPLRQLHETLERLIAESSDDAVILRPGMFASNVVGWWAPQIQRGDIVRWPLAGVETAPVDERDIAAVAATALLEHRPARRDYVLTGPESLSHSAQVKAIGEVLGRPLSLEEISPDEFRRDTAGVWPPAAVEMLLGAWQASIGHPAHLTRVIEEVLGRPARTFAQWVRDHAALFNKGA